MTKKRAKLDTAAIDKGYETLSIALMAALDDYLKACREALKQYGSSGDIDRDLNMICLLTRRLLGEQQPQYGVFEAATISIVLGIIRKPKEKLPPTP